MSINIVFVLMLGFVVNTAWAQDDSSVSGDTHIKLNDVEISKFIETIGKITGKNFIVDPRVQGKVTLLTSKPISSKEIYQLFKATLRVHGYLAQEQAGYVTIIPANSSKQLGELISASYISDPNSIVTDIVELEYAQVANILRIIQPMLNVNGYVAMDESENTLILSDTHERISKLRQLISKLDKANKHTIEVIPLKYAASDQLGTILQELIDKDTQANGKHITVTNDANANRILLSGQKDLVNQYQSIAKRLDVEPTEQTSFPPKVYYLKYTKAEQIAPIVESLIRAADAASSVFRFNIQAEPSSNTLIAMGPHESVLQAEQLIQQLDIRQAQVLVEAIIAEISSTKASELGIQWALGENDGAAISKFNGPGPDILQLESNPRSVGNGLTLGFGRFNNGNFNFGALLQALATDGQTNIISTPSLLTIDNTEAEIIVGQNVPFVTGQYTSGGGDSGSTPFQTIKRHDVGLRLKITPQINHGDAIKISIDQEISNISSQSNTAADIVTNKRSIKTQVIANDKQLIILGGLIDDSLQETHEKIPLLGDLPVIGNAFKSRKTQIVKRNLIVFLRPTIIYDPNQASQHSNIKYRDFQTLQGSQATDVQLFPDEQRPVLESLQGSKAPEVPVKPQTPTADTINW